MYQHHIFKKTVPDSVSATSEKLKAIWGKAKLTTNTDANIRKNVKNLFEEYQALKKDRNRITDGAELKRKIWKGDLENLFDISSADVLERRDILDEDKKASSFRREKIVPVRTGNKITPASTNKQAVPKYRANVGLGPRRAVRASGLEGTSKWASEDRIAVVATGQNFEEILGVPVAQDGTGQEVARTVFQEVKRVGAREQIIGLSFDTTALNSGMLAGACVHLENLLGRFLLWLACRHHLLEVVLKHVFEKCCGPSTGPEIPTFKRGGRR
ncbi:hypothetical protein GWK47_006894 [Chionoecetes opilio]|uniref:Uncharacterized protein n=1 Tax=Chionoecetes opilio TaxID=41210 RepID=A0A8J4YC95_CHIOP|nr:hypothetical protein GWK47_006894 [Chionoecetes opilio]